ncbi:MAG: hypothetical protein ACJ76J_08045 [Thermoanaerobaculia bacterium]
MPSIRKSFGWVLLAVAALAGPAEAATGTISSAASTLVLASGQTAATVVTWSTSGAAKAQVWVRADDMADTLFAQGVSGSKSASILPGRAYEFTLYDGGEHTIALANALVLGVASSGGTITSTPFVVRAPYGGTSTAALRWATQGFSTAEVWLSLDGGTEQLFARAVSGAQSAPWIQPGHDYRFNLYAGTSHSQLLDSVRVYGDLSYEVGVNYHATDSDFPASAFLTRYHLPGVRDTVRGQLQDMADRGASVIKHSIWMVTSPGSPDYGEAWRSHFPISSQEAANLRAFAQDVAGTQAQDGRRLKLDLTLLWLGDADFQRGSPSTGLGWANLTAAEFTSRVNQTVGSVVDAVKDVLRPDQRRVVETVYFNGEVMIGARLNEQWFLKTHYPGFHQLARNAGLQPSLYFFALASEADVLKDSFVDPSYPVLNGHRSMYWIYRSLRFLRNNGLPLPQRIDFSCYPQRTSASYPTLVQRIFDDADATLPTLGLARRYGAVETYYPTSNPDREALGDAFAAQRLVNSRLERTVFWTTPDGGGTGIDAGYPLEVEDYWP